MIFFTSDEHYGHRSIVKQRTAFADAGVMGEELVKRHNTLVRDDDDVYHLGDFALDDRIVPWMLPLLRGRHHLVSGNHDRCHPCHTHWEREVRRYLNAGFVAVHEQLRMVVAPLGEVLLCHLPYAGDRSTEPRCLEFRPKPASERALLHGHVHELWRVQQLDRAPPMVNVGVDQWGFAPVTAAQIATVLAAESR